MQDDLNAEHLLLPLGGAASPLLLRILPRREPNLGTALLPCCESVSSLGWTCQSINQLLPQLLLERPCSQPLVKGRLKLLSSVTLDPSPPQPIRPGVVCKPGNSNTT